jgi:hypothetical protein
LDIELRAFTGEEPVRENNNPAEEIWSFPLSSWAYYHKLRQMEWIVQLGFELDIYQVDELAGMYWYVVPVNTSRSRSTDLMGFLGLRYLQHLASTRLQHLDRIRVFTTRAFALIVKPSPKQSSSFARSFSFLDLAMLEASAIQNFAVGLACVGTLQMLDAFSGYQIVEEGY